MGVLSLHHSGWCFLGLVMAVAVTAMTYAAVETVAVNKDSEDLQRFFLGRKVAPICYYNLAFCKIGCDKCDECYQQYVDCGLNSYNVKLPRPTTQPRDGSFINDFFRPDETDNTGADTVAILFGSPPRRVDPNRVRGTYSYRAPLLTGLLSWKIELVKRIRQALANDSSSSSTTTTTQSTENYAVLPDESKGQPTRNASGNQSVSQNHTTILLHTQNMTATTTEHYIEPLHHTNGSINFTTSSHPHHPDYTTETVTLYPDKDTAPKNSTVEFVETHNTIESELAPPHYDYATTDKPQSFSRPDHASTTTEPDKSYSRPQYSDHPHETPATEFKHERYESDRNEPKPHPHHPHDTFDGKKHHHHQSDLRNKKRHHPHDRHHNHRDDADATKPQHKTTSTETLPYQPPSPNWEQNYPPATTWRPDHSPAPSSDAGPSSTLFNSTNPTAPISKPTHPSSAAPEPKPVPVPI